MSTVERQGFEIIPRLFDWESLSPAIKALDQMPLQHGRAGARNALRMSRSETWRWIQD
jgi:hypothetical protein